jgi:Cutinase
MYHLTALTVLLTAVTAYVVPIPPVQDKQTTSCSAMDCKKIHLIYARATGEPGTMGHSVGSLMASGFIEEIGSRNFFAEGVQYPADRIGAVMGALNPKGSTGAQTMAAMAEKVMKECPQSNIVLCGYSQGAEQVHGALMNLGPSGKNITVSSYIDSIFRHIEWVLIIDA